MTLEKLIYLFADQLLTLETSTPPHLISEKFFHFLSQKHCLFDPVRLLGSMRTLPDKFLPDAIKFISKKCIENLGCTDIQLHNTYIDLLIRLGEKSSNNYTNLVIILLE